MDRVKRWSRTHLLVCFRFRPSESSAGGAGSGLLLPDSTADPGLQYAGKAWQLEDCANWAEEFQQAIHVCALFSKPAPALR